MKRILPLLFALLTSFAIVQMTQAQPMGDVERALSAGNATALSVFFDANVELTIGDNDGAYSKAQAEQMVKKFFRELEIDPFTFLHKGTSGGNSTYAIGTLETNIGDFRTMVVMKKVGAAYLIRQLKIEED